MIIRCGDQEEAQVGWTRQISKLDIVVEHGPACQPRGIVAFWRYVTIVPNCDRSGMPSRGCVLVQREIVVNSVWVHVGIQRIVHRVLVHVVAHADMQVLASRGAAIAEAASWRWRPGGRTCPPHRPAVCQRPRHH